jgi:hypothetical protein
MPSFLVLGICLFLPGDGEWVDLVSPWQSNEDEGNNYGASNFLGMTT